MKKSTIFFRYYCIMFMAMVFISSCQKEIEKTIVESPLIQPPIPEWVPEFISKEFDISKGLNWAMKNGTTIRIPANALMGMDSSSLNGKAILKFRDYHDAVDIFLSGIPMVYQNSKGEPGNMETAGMFEIRAEVNGKNALLKNGKTIKVDLVSRVGSKGYNSYFLNEKKRNWEFLSKNKARVNSKKTEQKKLVNELKPEMVFPLGRKYFALDYRILLDEYFHNDYRKFNDALFQEKLEKYGLSWLDATSKDGVEYNGKKQPASLMVWKKISDEKIPSWVKNSDCSFRKKGGNRYILRIHKKGQNYFTDLEVELVMPVNYLFRLPPEEWAKDYQTAFTKFKKEEKRLAVMSDFFRALPAKQFGIYNYDRIMKEEEAILMVADFNFGKTFDKNVSQPAIYYIPGSERAVVKYPQYQWNDFPLMPEKGGMFFSLLPDNKIAVFKRKDYGRLNFEKIRTMEKPTHEFNMVLNGKDISSGEELKEFLLERS